MSDTEDLGYIQEEIERLRANLKTNSHWFLGWRTARIQQETNFFAVQIGKLEAYVRLKHHVQTIEARLEHEKALEAKSFESQIAIAQAMVDKEVGLKKLQQTALDMGLTLEGFLALRTLEETQRINREHEKRMVDIRLDEHERRSQIDTRQYENRKEIDFRYSVKDMELQIKGALTYQHLMDERALLLLRKLNDLVAERHQVLFSGLPIMLVEQQTRNMTIVIESWSKELARLLQNNNGQGQEGSVSDSERRGLPGADVEEGEK